MQVEVQHMREALASYIEATYHLSNPTIVALRRDLLSGGGIAQEPYIESTPAYRGEREFKTLALSEPVRNLLTDLASVEAGRLLFDPPFEHQADALEAALAPAAGGHGIVVTTGTGSGKTECFLLPVLSRLAEEATKRPAHFAERAVRALLLYPMNALVNDQLGRLRTLFGAPAVRNWFTAAADRPAKFGRYTGRTLYPGMRNGDRDQKRLKTLDYYLRIEDKARAGDLDAAKLVRTLQSKGRWPSKPETSIGAFDGLRNWYGRAGAHWEDINKEPLRAVEHLEDPELLTRHEIQAASPDLLITNYSMLEYMLLRPIERDIFTDTRAYFEAHSDETFFLILDEAHLYRGANGTEVAYLLRRLLDRIGLPASRVVFIATSASFSNTDAAATFVAGLTGLDPAAITILSGTKRAFEPAAPGDLTLAKGLATVPLAAFQSSSPTDRSTILVPLVSYFPPVDGARVILKRSDSGPDVVRVRVSGLRHDGQPLEEMVSLAAGAEVATIGAFLIVDAVDTSGGRVAVARSYPLGVATPNGMIWDHDDLPGALAEILSGTPVIGRLRNITSGATSEHDIVSDVPGTAWPLSRLPATLFPKADPATGASAVDALLELASLARPDPDSPPLLPARVHMLFRGLPGLWACTNPYCTKVPDSHRGGPTGALYSEPRRSCDCGAQVYELHSCRSCGLAVASAHAGAPAGIEHLWQDNGSAYAGETNVLRPVHVCLENPDVSNIAAARAAYLDMRTGRIDGPGTFSREVWLATHFGNGLFDKCPRCNAPCGKNETRGISDLQTKGEQPFQELIAVQVLEQPPRPEVLTALQGRKALVFSDGRQTASRLAGTMKTFSFRDSLRPLLLAGMEILRNPKYRPSLDDAPLAVALGAARFGVRLRPAGDDQGRLDSMGRRALRLLGESDAESDDFRGLSGQTSSQTSLSVFQSLYAVLQDDHTGLFPLALAMLRPRLTKTDQQRLRDDLALPTVSGLSEEEVRTALVELWLWAAMRKHAIKLQHTMGNLEGASGSASLHKWNGNFSQIVQKLLATRGIRQWLKADFATRCLPTLRAVFAHDEPGEFFVQASKVSLDLGDDAAWLRCERCTSVSPRNSLLGDACGYCGGPAKAIDPTSDVVFLSRKSFYRRLWDRLRDPDDVYAPHQLIAEEHSAALNDSGLANAVSRNEAYELRFQDIPIEQDGQLGSPIDILSCTTTMEVGIDIGGLTAVALRNVPPGRANYQQRAGRAGRRGAGLSTVVMFCGADSHDQSFFRNPGPIVAGPAPDPILNLNNPVIARRQVFAYLIGRFQQDRVDTVLSGSGDVFSSLGSVDAFLIGADDSFSLAGLRVWLADNQANLATDLDRLFVASCPSLNAVALLKEFPAVLHDRLATVPADHRPAPVVAPQPSGEESDDEPIEGSPDEDHAVTDSGKLLDRLFDEGLLPKYAFPTDVVTFSVFEQSTDPWRPKRRYSPQQGLNAALSQYAPGHEVWVDGQRYISLGLYAEHEEDRLDAYRAYRLYYQCRVCNYADLRGKNDGYLDQTRDCPACNGRATLGPARRWVRPSGFAHPPALTALPPDFDAGTRLRPTRATLDSLFFDPKSRIGGATWPAGTGWEGWSDTKTLVVTNRGSLGATDYGFNYCARCGRTEPADFDPAMRQLRSGQPHDRPRPTRPKEPPQCDGGNPIKIVLGNEFQTDVAVFRLAIPVDWQLGPDRIATTIAARSAVEALRRAACVLDDLEPNDIDGDFRFAPATGGSQFIDLYLYDQAAGGAGFVKTAARDPQQLVAAALQLLDDCTCDDSCYQCLRSYKNRFEHALFDRRVGSDLLRACFLGISPCIDAAREKLALDRLQGDLEESGAVVTRLLGGLRDVKGQSICIAHPFQPDLPSSDSAKQLAAGSDTIAIDILLVLRALPVATAKSLSVSDVVISSALKTTDDGVPELSFDQVLIGVDASAALGPRYDVGAVEPGDFLFRLNAHTLSGIKGDGTAPVAKGALCLFRPHQGETLLQTIYLIRRSDSHAFGATGAAWTVGHLQHSKAGGMRVRYRAAPDRMECASELVQPVESILAIAKFIRKVQ
ncbi:MAG: hypothetical protein QOI12_3662 [Alphaproteobacteria bacterium]|jgi:ATP-dependent helicase YprA (DUF1998 family)|nr:hypothetical protein [Alphaproteobacteria bacterium]